MANDPLRSDPVFGKLKRMTGLDYVTLDGERKVEVPKAGNRWRKLADIMDGIEWDTCEAFNAKGTLIGVVQNEGAEEDDEDDARDASAPVTIEALANVMSSLVSNTMRETREMFSAQMDGNARIIEGMAEANRTIADSYALALRVSSAATAATAAQASEGAPEIMDMLKLAMPMMMMSRQTAPQQPQPQPAPQQRPAPQRRPRPAPRGLTSTVPPPRQAPQVDVPSTEAKP